MSYRDPFSGRFASKAQYRKAIRRLTAARARAFQKGEDTKEFARLSQKAQRYKPIADEIEEDVSDEWQFGADYKASRRYHDVMIDVRLTFDEPVTEREARQAVKRLIRGGHPAGVSVEAVDWKSGKRWKAGDEDDLSTFRDVLYAGEGRLFDGVDYLRAGAVKPDKL